MKNFPSSLTILEYFGTWPSPKYYSGWKKIIYDSYTLIMYILLFSACLSGIIDLCFFTNNVNEFLTSSFMLVSMISILIKVSIFISKRNDLVKIFKFLQHKIFQEKNEDERQIQYDWDPQLNISLQTYRSLALTAVIFSTASSIQINVPTRTLPYKGYLPYNHTDNLGYWTAFLHQSVSCYWSALVCTSIDAIFCGIMMQICGQLKILKYRFLKMPEVAKDSVRLSQNDNTISRIINVKKCERELIANCIQHHLLILQLVDMSNNILSSIIFNQFITSTLVVCISAAYLTNLKFMSAEFISVISYFGCVGSQIFLYCWFGNEVILESSDIYMAIYEIDWLKLSLSTQKDLLIIMTRSLHPIQLTCGRVIILSINTYVALMKLSFSIYNLLRSTD